MTGARKFRTVRRAALACLVSGWLVSTIAVWAQEARVPASPRVLLVSDIHFEPFWDPAKTVTLAAAPVAQWKSILTAPDSPNRAARFAALQQACHARGEDTPERLLDSTMRAMHAQATGVRFVLLSGDLISHDFQCKYAIAFPTAKPGSYRTFVEKTIEYSIGRLRETIPGVPVYPALGNNDTGCGDDHIDAKGAFLHGLRNTMTADVPEGKRKIAQTDFALAGYYSVDLPAPMVHTRLLVLDDLFMKRGYKTCSGKADASAGASQIAWLQQQLEDARQNKKRVWVMAHVPPGFPVYGRETQRMKFCAGGPLRLPLSSGALKSVLGQYGDVIRLAVFGHTHKDEIRLLQPPGSQNGGIPVKVVPAITPIGGSNPAFIVGKIDVGSARIKDYRVMMASNRTGVGTMWHEEYEFSPAYKEPDFSATSVRDLLERLERDPNAQSSESRTYLRGYAAGKAESGLLSAWPQYVCSMSVGPVEAFRACVCGKRR